jgi:hypothetical protein
MKKQTLKFRSFAELSSFVKSLSIGYLINTNTLTVTALFSESLIQLATLCHHATLIETTERVYSYDPL